MDKFHLRKLNGSHYYAVRYTDDTVIAINKKYSGFVSEVLPTAHNCAIKHNYPLTKTVVIMACTRKRDKVLGTLRNQLSSVNNTNVHESQVTCTKLRTRNSHVKESRVKSQLVPHGT